MVDYAQDCQDIFENVVLIILMGYVCDVFWGIERSYV
jgi:hypothetical protein